MQFSKVISVIFTAFVATAVAQNCTAGEYDCDNSGSPSTVLVCDSGEWTVINTCADDWTCFKDASGGCTCQEA